VSQAEVKSEPLDQEANHILEESRMVLPGIQALFGFQLIAVYSERFQVALAEYEQALHLVAIGLVAISIALIMAPAAYHRQAERGCVSRYFTELSSNLLTWGMAPLCLAIMLELYLVSRIVLDSVAVSLAVAGLMFVIFVGLWFVFPRFRAWRHNGW